MKIVINALSARLGGGQTYVKNLLGHLPDRRDLEVQVFAPASLLLPSDPRIRRRSVGWPTDNPILRTLWEIVSLPGILAQERADVLFCPGGVIASRVPSHCKTATMFRNMMPFDRAVIGKLPLGWQKLRNLMLRRAMLKSMSSADLTIFISEHARGIIERLALIPQAVTIPHGISDSFRTHDKQLPRPTWLPSGEYLLYVSRFDVYKHQREVAQAFCMLPDELRLRYTLLFVGEFERWQADEILRLAAAGNASDRIRVAGAVPYAELPGAYRHAAVNVFASSCENCPNILLEALGAGRPVLSSRVMPMPEFGADAVEYFDPADPASICDAMTRVLTSDGRYRQLGELAARRSDDFDWARSANETWQRLSALATG